MADIVSLSDALSLGNDGIWYAKKIEEISYPAQGNDNCYAVESGSYWFHHRNQCIVAMVNAFPPADNGIICDIGGGNGFVALGLSQAGYDVILLEPGQSGASNAKQRGLQHVICASSETAQINPGSLAAVGLFDVIEHIEDDKGFLQSICTLLGNEGRLYTTVPAYQFLWSGHDTAAGHYRRYSLAQICTLLESAGFEVEFASYFFRPLPLPILLFRALPFKLGFRTTTPESTKTHRDHASSNTALSRFLRRHLRPEISLISRGKSMGFGGSCIVTAKVAAKLKQ